jgi:hypothetical protein
MEQIEEELEQLKEEYEQERLELKRLLERSSVQVQDDDLDLATIVSKSVPVRVRVGEPAQPPAKKSKLDPPPRQQETAQAQRQQQECMMQMMPLLPAITNT